MATTTLTNAQFQTLLAAVTGDATANGYKLAGDSYSLLAWCNGAASPAQPAWRLNVPAQDADEAATYTTYDSLIAGKRDSWGIFLRFNRDFSRNKVRNWVTDVWGNATAGSIAEAVLQAGTESATRAQAAIGGTSKTTGTVTALDRNYVGLVSQAEVNRLVAA